MKKVFIIFIFSLFIFSCGKNSDTSKKESESFIYKNIPIPNSSEVCNNIYHEDDIDGSITLISCDENCEMIDDDCYHSYDMQVLLEIVNVNKEYLDSYFYQNCISNKHFLLDLGTKQKWKNGRLILLDLSWDGGDRIGILPKNICNLTGIKWLDVSDNNLCETYFYDCIDVLGSQYFGGKENEREDCPGEYSFYDSGRYYDSDIQVLKDLRESNQSLTDIPLLKIGKQKWINGRLVELNLSDNEKIDIIPETIINLIDLKRLEIKSDNVITLTQIPKPRFNFDNTFHFILNGEQTIYKNGKIKK